MARKRAARPTQSIVENVLDEPEASLVDVLDHVLAKGVMATGDVTLGVAGIDLIYLRLASLLCAADRVMPVEQLHKKRRRRSRPVTLRRR
jgi:hypothetical protein